MAGSTFPGGAFPAAYDTYDGVLLRAKPLILRARSFLDPRLTVHLEDLWPSRCTIQTITYTTSPNGQQVPSGGTDISSLTLIPCRLAPLETVTPSEHERRDASVTEQYTRRNLKLNGYYPTITPRSMRAMVDGTAYLIRGVDSDSEFFLTRLLLEIVYPRTTF